jgi:HNH endonuclease
MNPERLPLTRGKVALVDAEDLATVLNYKWHAFPIGHTWYAATSVNGRRSYLHRMILRAPQGLVTDHKNGDGLDNRRENLRLCRQGQNLQNMKNLRGGHSSYKGVSKSVCRENPWRAYIQVKKRMIHLGVFPTERAAALAYNTAASRYFGAFALLNDMGI